MFDGNFRSGVDRVTRPVGHGLMRLGVTADMITGLGVLISAGAAYLLATGHLGWAAVVLISGGLPDLLDGAVAKASGTQSIRGAFFDSVCDRISDSLLFAGLAWLLLSGPNPTEAIVAVALLGLSQLIPYMRAKAEIFDFVGKGGLMERGERVFSLAAILLISAFWSSAMLPLLWVFAGLVLFTVLQRFAKIWDQATSENPVLAARRETNPWFRPWREVDEQRRRAKIERLTTRRRKRRSVSNASNLTTTANPKSSTKAE